MLHHRGIEWLFLAFPFERQHIFVWQRFSFGKATVLPEVGKTSGQQHKQGLPARGPKRIFVRQRKDDSVNDGILEKLESSDVKSNNNQVGPKN